MSSNSSCAVTSVSVMERWRMSSGSSGPRYALRRGADLRLSMSCAMMSGSEEIGSP
jgi:hypothetical protein